MKKLIMSLAVAVFTVAVFQAQENKTIKKESTIKRVVTKEGSEVKVKETQRTQKVSGSVIVEDDNKTNQEFREIDKKNSDKKVLRKDINLDPENQALIAENKRKEQAQLEASIKQQKELAEKRRLELQAKQEQKQKELAERRARLTSRPKGIVKYQNK